MNKLLPLLTTCILSVIKAETPILNHCIQEASKKHSQIEKWFENPNNLVSIKGISHKTKVPYHAKYDGNHKNLNNFRGIVAYKLKTEDQEGIFSYDYKNGSIHEYKIDKDKHFIEKGDHYEIIEKLNENHRKMIKINDTQTEEKQEFLSSVEVFFETLKVLRLEQDLTKYKSLKDVGSEKLHKWMCEESKTQKTISESLHAILEHGRNERGRGQIEVLIGEVKGLLSTVDGELKGKLDNVIRRLSCDEGESCLSKIKEKIEEVKREVKIKPNNEDIMKKLEEVSESYDKLMLKDVENNFNHHKLSEAERSGKTIGEFIDRELGKFGDENPLTDEYAIQMVKSVLSKMNVKCLDGEEEGRKALGKIAIAVSKKSNINGEIHADLFANKYRLHMASYSDQIIKYTLLCDVLIMLNNELSSDVELFVTTALNNVFDNITDILTAEHITAILLKKINDVLNINDPMKIFTYYFNYLEDNNHSINITDHLREICTAFDDVKVEFIATVLNKLSIGQNSLSNQDVEEIVKTIMLTGKSYSYHDLNTLLIGLEAVHKLSDIKFIGLNINEANIIENAPILLNKLDNRLVNIITSSNIDKPTIEYAINNLFDSHYSYTEYTNSIFENIGSAIHGQNFDSQTLVRLVQCMFRDSSNSDLLLPLDRILYNVLLKSNTETLKLIDLEASLEYVEKLCCFIKNKLNIYLSDSASSKYIKISFNNIENLYERISNTKHVAQNFETELEFRNKAGHILNKFISSLNINQLELIASTIDDGFISRYLQYLHNQM